MFLGSTIWGPDNPDIPRTSKSSSLRVVKTLHRFAQFLAAEFAICDIIDIPNFGTLW